MNEKIWDGLERAIDEVIAPGASTVDEEGVFPQVSLAALADLGLLGATIPAAEGGLGLSAVELSRVVMELGAACASTAMVYVMHLTALSAVMTLMAPAARERHLRRIVKENALVSEAISEPGAGSQWWSVHSTAERLPDGDFRVRADKSFCTAAGYADLYVVSTQAPGQSSDRNHALFLIDGRSEGIESGNWRGLGLRGNMSSTIRFDCVVPASGLLAADDGGGVQETLRKYNEVNQPLYHLGVGATYAGISKAALNAVCNRVGSRRYAGDPGGQGSHLKDYAIAQRHIGVIASGVLQSEALVHHFASRLDEGEGFDDFAMEMTAVKSACADNAVSVTTEAMMAAGGTAYVKGLLPIERQLRDALAAPLMGPNNDFCKELIGRLALGGSYHEL